MKRQERKIKQKTRQVDVKSVEESIVMYPRVSDVDNVWQIFTQHIQKPRPSVQYVSLGGLYFFLFDFFYFKFRFWLLIMTGHKWRGLGNRAGDMLSVNDIPQT